MDKEVYFYFNVTNNYGLGHYSRCSVLNTHLIKRGLKTYLVTPHILKKKKFKEFKIIHLDKVIKKGGKTLIIDDYKIDNKRILFLKNFFSNVVLIDDIPTQKSADAIVNTNYSIKKKNYKNLKIKKFFLGIEYKLIKKNKKRKTNQMGCVISFGSGNVFKRVKKILMNILSDLNKLKYDRTINLFINLTKNQKKTLYRHQFLDLKINKISKEFFSKLRSSEFVVSSLGVQHDEILNLGLPSIFVKIDNNQDYNFKLAKKINSEFVFQYKKYNSRKLKNALKKIQEKNIKEKIIKNYKRVKLGSKIDDLINYIIKKQND